MPLSSELLFPELLEGTVFCCADRKVTKVAKKMKKDNFFIFDRFFNKLVLKKYLTEFLMVRNAAIKELAEKQVSRK